MQPSKHLDKDVCFRWCMCACMCVCVPVHLNVYQLDEQSSLLPCEFVSSQKNLKRFWNFMQLLSFLHWISWHMKASQPDSSYDDSNYTGVLTCSLPCVCCFVLLQTKETHFMKYYKQPQSSSSSCFVFHLSACIDVWLQAASSHILGKYRYHFLSKQFPSLEKAAEHKLVEIGIDL